MSKLPYNPTEDEVKAEIKKYGYWEITLRPETDTKLSIEECKDIFLKSQIRHGRQFFPFTPDDPFEKKYRIKNDGIKDHVHHAQYIIWWIFHTNGLFEIETGIIEDRHNGINNNTFCIWTPDKQIPPPNKNLDPIITLHKLMEIEQFTKNLMENVGLNYYMSVNLCNMEGRQLQSLWKTDLSTEYSTIKPTIDEGDPNNSICKVNKIELESKIISEDNLETTFVIEYMHHIYNKFNHYTSDMTNFNNIIENEMKVYHNIENSRGDKHNYKSKK